MAIKWAAHGPKQELALFATTPLVVLGCGIQFGKTAVGSFWMAMKCHQYAAETDNFIIVAPTYKILSQSTLPPFLAIMNGRGDFNKAEMTFKVRGGGMIYFRSGDNPDSIVGITNVRAIWGDEAGLFGLYFSENIAARAAFKGAQILYTTSPYSLNWLYHRIILPKLRDNTARPDVTLIQAASWENPYFPKDVIERNRKTMDPKRFNAMFGGNWERMEGLVYDCWDDRENTIEGFTLPAGTKFYAGVDWGHTHPFVLAVRAITPNGMHYGVSEYFKSGLTITDMIEIARSKMITWGIERFFCGPDRPENIVEFCRSGIPAVPAKNDVLLGIDVHYQLIKTRRFKVFQGASPYLVDEMAKYHWPSPEELDQDRDAKERNPVKQDDDACFAPETPVNVGFCRTKRIDQIRPGERILTPFGYRKVISCGITKIDAEIVRKFGMKLTPDHKVFDLESGFTKACEANSVWQWNVYFLMAATIIFGAFIGFLRAMARARKLLSSITPFGSKKTEDPSQMVFTSIIGTGTGTTTLLKTSNALTEATTSENTPNREKNRCASTSTNAFVETVRKISRHEPISPSSARSAAATSTDMIIKLITRTGLANFAARRFQPINTQKHQPADRHAQASSNPERVPAVYNLKVDVGCFFANGILVSNCDANRYVSIMTSTFDQTKRKVHTPQENTKLETHEFIERLKAKRRPTDRTENWS